VFLLHLAVVLLALVAAAGCGGGHDLGADVGSDADAATGAAYVGAAESAARTDAGEVEDDVTAGTGRVLATAGWEPPSVEVEAVFQDLAKNAGFPVFAPSELPVGTHSAGVDGAGANGDLGANGDFDVPDPIGGSAGGVRVILKSPGGWIQVLEDVRADLGDLPSREETVAGDLSGVVARLLGGTLVQWMWEGRLYAIYVQGLPEEDALRLAQGMVRLEGK
jgi:hypothetical protein